MAKQNIRSVKGVGERREKQLLRLGIESVESLLHYYPRRYIDLRAITLASDAKQDVPELFRLTVYRKHPPVRLPGGKTLYKVSAGDDSGYVTVAYFNNRYAAGALSEGRDYLFYGKFKRQGSGGELINPVTMNETDAGGLWPQYSATEGLSSRAISGIVKDALFKYRGSIGETLPVELLERHGYIGLSDALAHIHAPKDYTEVEKARERLIFDELFILQLGMLLFKAKSRRSTASVMKADDLLEFYSSLPYTLTEAQLRCIREITSDLSRPVPMSRLLQGDVGSGKTVVAAAAIATAMKSGYQSAVMAPTEVLAAQHMESLSALLSPLGARIGLLTGAVKGKQRGLLLDAAAAGEIDIVVGTHALISEKVTFSKLGFVVADEQHRFGVEQRMRLSLKGDNPHLLVMSATPIPRTLALMIYGDLDLSVIDEMPKGRIPPKTYLVSDAYRERYLRFIKEKTSEGGLAFIVCPLIEENETADDRRAATQYKEELEAGPLLGCKVGLVHGRMKAAEKQRAVEAFKNAETSVLVSTTVIEVGVDIPRANIMVIENAESFGLSALHQLRGRIGRGFGESYCILVAGNGGEASEQRLRILTESNDGFAIANFDLMLRGPGEFFGRRQHGLPELRIADLMKDDLTLSLAGRAAKELLDSDPELLRHTGLKARVDSMFGSKEGAFN